LRVAKPRESSTSSASGASVPRFLPRISDLIRRAGSRRFFVALLAIVAALASGAMYANARLMTPIDEPPVYGDTVVVWGPFTADEQGWNHEAFGIEVKPGRQYLLKVENGLPDGSRRMTEGFVRMEGFKPVTPEEVALGGPGWLKRIITTDSNWVTVEITQPSNAIVKVSLLETVEPTYTFYETRLNASTTGDWTTLYHELVIPSGIGAPFYLCSANGNIDGTSQYVNTQYALGNVPVTQNGYGAPPMIVPFSPVTGDSLKMRGWADSLPAFVDVCVMGTDIADPVLTIATPASNLVTADSVITVSGTVLDSTSTVVRVDGDTATLGSGNSWSINVTLVEGLNTLNITAIDAAGNQADTSRVVYLDRIDPEVVITTPAADGFVFSSPVTLAGTVSDASSFTLNVNGTPVTVDSLGNWSTIVAAPNETNVYVLTATDAAGNVGTAVRIVRRDLTDPTLVVTTPVNNDTTASPNVSVTGTVVDSSAVVLTINGDTVPIVSGAFEHLVPLIVGSNSVLVIATDIYGNETTVSRTVVRIAESTLPPDPATVATALDPTQPWNMFAAMEFLWAGPDSIQKGVASGTIDPTRVVVARGRVLDVNADSLSGVSVRVVGHAEYGQTLSRLDGYYDLAMNGGGPLTLEFEKAGYLKVQRTLRPKWQEWVMVDSVVMTPLDTNVATVDFTDPVQVARGSATTDADGTRRATVMFFGGTRAALLLPNGSIDSIETMNVRATEYTVGDLGVAAMPGELPPATAYTYAVELSVDEAMAVGARAVRFSQPVHFYVENFLDIPVGSAVPVGTYDRQIGAWKPDLDGRVIAILDTVGGVASVAVTSAGTAAGMALLDSLGFTTNELQRLAALYPIGTHLWRARLTEFSPKDLNPTFLQSAFSVPANVDFDRTGETFDCTTCETTGSTIGVQNQTLGETLPVVGTPLTLSYVSDRAQGARYERRLVVPAQTRVDTAVYAAGTPPGRNEFGSHMASATYWLEIAGRRIEAGTFPGNANIPPAPVEWDGLDAMGRRVNGPQKARVQVEFNYPVFLWTAPFPGAGIGRTFGAGGSPDGVPTQLARRPVSTRQTWEGVLGAYDGVAHSFGGWSLSAHRVYDPTSGTINHGNGRRRRGVVVRGMAVTRHSAGGAPLSMATGPDGAIYMAYSTYVERRPADGTVAPVVVAGIPDDGGYDGEGLPAVASRLEESDLRRIAFGPDGLLYITEGTGNRIRRIDPDGALRTIAGTGSSTSSGDDGLATVAGVAEPSSIAFLPDGSLIFAEAGQHWVRRIAPNGFISRFAGTGDTTYAGDGGLAIEAGIGTPTIAVARDGTVYLYHEMDGESGLIRRVRPNGVIERFAGVTADTVGTPAQLLFLQGASDLTVAPNGDVHFPMDAKIFAITPSGNVRVVAGSRPRCENEDTLVLLAAVECELGPTAGLARQFPFAQLDRIATLPDGRLLVADGADSVRYVVAPPQPGFSEEDISIASEDGGEVYHFNRYGRHLRTLDAMSRDTVLQFAYDSTGWLTGIIDADGEVTTIERTGAVATAIVGANGHRTELGYDGNGFLNEVTNPAGEVVTLVTSATGLLQRLTDPRGGQYAFAYDSLGRLVRDSSAAGRVQTLARVATDTSSTVTLTDDLGRTTTHRLDRLAPQHRRRTVIDAAGLATVSTTFANDSTLTVLPDSTVTMVVNVGDSRFGAQASVLRQMETRLPSGLTSEVTASRTATLASAADPLSLTSLLDSMRVNGRVHERLYTRATRTLVTTSPMGRTTTTVYDTAGRIVSSTVPGIQAATFGYDASGRLSYAQTGGRASTFAYDAKGRLLSATDPMNRRDSLFYDDADRLTRRVLADGRQVTIAYDSAGNLVGIVPPGKPSHTFAYAPADRLAVYNPPTNGLGTSATTYSYNTAGQPTVIRRPTADSISFAYDFAGRPSTVAFDRGSIGFNYNSVTGALSSLSAPGGLGLSFTYDGQLPTSVTWSGTVAGSMSVLYNDDFRVFEQSVNEGHTVNFEYDQDGLLVYAGALALERDELNGRLTADRLDIDEVTQRNTYSYDAHGALSALLSTRDSDTLFSTGYVRDSLSRITQLTERVNGVTQVMAFTYDSVGRLSTVTRNSVLTASYTYDLNGNRATKVTSGGTTTAVVDDQDRLTSYGGVTYQYTNNGELRRRIVGTDTTVYTYDALGNLTEVKLHNGTVIGYLIDGQNRRIGKTVNDTLVRAWLYQGQLTPVAELDGSGNVVSRFVYATGINVPDYMVRGDSTYRLIRDHLGSVRLVVNVASGTIAQRLAYDEFGTQVENTTPDWQPFGYAGGISDSHSGLVRFGARDYDPVIGRWTAKDPIGFAGGLTNLYSYVAADPINALDPLGLVKWSGSFHARTLVVGMGSGYISLNLTSECVKGQKYNVELTVAGPGVGAGMEGLIGGDVHGNITIDDMRSYIEPTLLEGHGGMISAGVQVGTLGLGLTYFRLGNFVSSAATNTRGLDVGATWILGSSTITGGGGYTVCGCK
jgi:RHS repeat-associated protein